MMQLPSNAVEIDPAGLVVVTLPDTDPQHALAESEALRLRLRLSGLWASDDEAF